MSERRFDLIVVGAGVLGVFHAFHAARRGKRVLLLEKDQYPRRATVRNFGQVVPSGMGASWFKYGELSSRLYQEIQQEFDISVRNNGSVYVASDNAEQQLIHELKASMDGRGYDSVLLSTKKCLDIWPALDKDYCREALYFPQELSIEPERMIYRLLEYSTAKFVNLIYRPATAVRECVPSVHGVKVTTMDGLLFEAEKVIICNGGEFKLLFADLFRESGIAIAKLQMMRTVPMPEIRLEGNILTGLTIRRYESFTECPSFKSLTVPDHLKALTKCGIHILFKKASDGSFIIGDSHEYAEASHSDDLGFAIRTSINDLIISEASRIVTFDVRNLASCWAGFYPQHPEKEIVEYDLGDCIHIRTAIGGKGMTTSAGYAEESIRKIFNLS